MRLLQSVGSSRFGDMHERLTLGVSYLTLLQIKEWSTAKRDRNDDGVVRCSRGRVGESNASVRPGISAEPWLGC